MMNLDINTFGKTPAAHYLARRLNDLQSKTLNRSCTVRVNSFNQNCSAIENSINAGVMQAKIGANLLRMMREEASNIQLYHDSLPIKEVDFVANLLRNVIIGHIKSAMRKISICRKVENGTKDLNTIHNKGSVKKFTIDPELVGVTSYTIMGYDAATVYTALDGDYEPVRSVMVLKDLYLDDIDDPTTPKVLHDRSVKRCARQGKAWALAQNS